MGLNVTICGVLTFSACAAGCAISSGLGAVGVGVGAGIGSTSGSFLARLFK